MLLLHALVLQWNHTRQHLCMTSGRCSTLTTPQPQIQSPSIEARHLADQKKCHRVVQVQHFPGSSLISIRHGLSNSRISLTSLACSWWRETRCLPTSLLLPDSERMPRALVSSRIWRCILIWRYASFVKKKAVCNGSSESFASNLCGIPPLRHA